VQLMSQVYSLVLLVERTKKVRPMGVVMWVGFASLLWPEHWAIVTTGVVNLALAARVFRNRMY
jgi:hypothetical protein